MYVQFTSCVYGDDIFKNLLTLRLKLATILSCNFVTFYRSPSQTKDEFENLMKTLELNLQHTLNKSPFLIVGLRDFNARMQGWYQNVITTLEGSKIDMAFSKFSFEPNNKRTNIYFEQFGFLHRFNFTSQPKIVIHSGVHPSLHPNCHHQTAFKKFSLTIFLSSALQTISLALSAS